MSAVFPIEDNPRFAISTASDGQTDFAVPFPFQANADVVVVKIVDDAEFPLDEGEDYTLTGAGEAAGGTLTLVAPAEAGWQIVRYGNVVLERLSSITRNGRYDSKATDDDLDRAIIALQEARRDLGRAWKAALGSSGNAIAAGAEFHLPVFDASGNMIEGPDWREIAAGNLSPAAILALLLTVDGAGSGLEADKLDGHDAAYFQAVTALLTSLHALTLAADTGIYATGANSLATFALSAFARTLLDDANAAASRATLGLGTAAVLNTGTAAGNVPLLDGSGLLDTNVLPAIAITDVFTVASQAAMLALTAQKGDIAIRSDLNKSFALSTNSPSTLADWKELLTPTDTVLAVAGLTGTISAAALRTALSLVVGTDVQAYNARLADLAGLSLAQGDILYWNGSNLVKLSPGTSGFFLKTQGAAANPVWANIPGGGDMLSTNNLSDLASKIAAWDNISSKGTDVASAGTINLTTATGPRVDITGNTTVSAVTLANGSMRIARAAGVFQLTASSTLIVNKSSSVNYTTALNDLLIFTAEGGVTSVTVVGWPRKGPDVIVEDQKAQNTAGGTFTSGADRTRDLNTKVHDPYGYATVASNQVTLAPGTWYIEWQCPAYVVQQHQSLLYNATDASVVKRSMSMYSNGDFISVSMGSAMVTITAAKAFELRHRCALTSNTNGFGVPSNFGTETFSRFMATKVS